MTCPECNYPHATASKCNHCGVILGLSQKRLREIAEIRDATDGMTYTELLQWTAKLSAA